MFPYSWDSAAQGSLRRLAERDRAAPQLFGERQGPSEAAGVPSGPFAGWRTEADVTERAPKHSDPASARGGRESPSIH